MGTLSVVLGYMKRVAADDPAENGKLRQDKFGYMCLRFCDTTRTLSGFGGKVEKTVKVFRDALSKSLKEYPEEEMAAGKVVPDIEPITKQAWGTDLADVEWPPVEDEDGNRPPKITGPWNDSDSYRSFLLVKAFMEGARFMSLRMGATVPTGADGAWDRMFKLSQEQDTTTMDDVSTKGYKAAVSRMKIVPPDFKAEQPAKEPEKGKEPSAEPEKDKAPSKESEPNKDVLKTVDTLNKRVQEFKAKKPFMTSESQEKLQTLMEQILSLMTPRPIPETRSAGMGDAFSELVKYMRPMLDKFLQQARQESLPAEERVWSDPDRLREVLERMDPAQARAVLRKTEEILGLLHSLS